MTQAAETTIRKIIHIDMDAFFASVEQLRNPSLKGKPVLVGGSPDGRGVVAAASYEARRYGVHSAMPAAKALRRCPHAIFVKPDFEQYRYYSDIIRSIFLQYTDLVEPLSLDEAYLDVTHSPAQQGSATLIAKEIRQKIFKQTALTASAGVSYNKFLAKMASDINKPNGMAVILPEQAEALIADWPVERFHGIGKSTANKMHRLGIFLGSDIKALPLAELVKHFGKSGPHYYDLVRGIDEREVKPNRERKSIGKENTFNQDIYEPKELLDYLKQQCIKVCGKAKELGVNARTISLKARYPDFETITRSQTLRFYTSDAELVFAQLKEMLLKEVDYSRGIRLIGMNIHNFDRAELQAKQLELFREYAR